MSNYLNGWFPPVTLDAESEWLYHFHVADPNARNLGEWLYVGRATTDRPTRSEHSLEGTAVNGPIPVGQEADTA